MPQRPEDYIGMEVKLRIDRPMGSRHPRHGFIYPLNYGFVPDTVAPDGAERDAYVLGVFEPIERFEGRCIAVIRRRNDDDDKLIVVPEGREFTDEQILALTEFQERFFTVAVLRGNKVKDIQ